MKLKSLVAVVLSLIMCLSVVSGVPVLAAGKPAPVINVHGLMASTIYANLGTDEQKSVFPPETKSIIQAVAFALPGLISFAATSDWDVLLDTVNPLFMDILGESFCDSNGRVKEGTGVDWQYPDAETVRTNAETQFVYDWRLSPVESAALLNDYIKYVKSCTGSEKVSLICHSFGNNVGLTYVALYGTDDLEGFVCNASAFLGESYNGELMTGNLQINGDALCSYLKDNVFAGTDYEQAGYALCETLDLLFVTDAVEANANYSIEKVIDRASKEVILQWFGKWPSIWAMVPDEYYANARSHVFDTLLKDEDCTGLLNKLDEYDRTVRDKRDLIMNEVSKLNFGVVARYDKQKLPITNNPTALTDNNIDVKYASFGATTAEYNSTLPGDYAQARHTDIDYISPDNMIDASTCMFPERTWFIKNMGHAGSCPELDELFLRILSTDGFTVTSDPKFPQFLVYDIETDTLCAYEKYNAPKESAVVTIFSLLQRLKALILGLLNTILK